MSWCCPNYFVQYLVLHLRWYLPSTILGDCVSIFVTAIMLRFLVFGRGFPEGFLKFTVSPVLVARHGNYSGWLGAYLKFVPP